MALDIGSERVGVAICDPTEVAFTRMPPVAFRGAAAVAEQVARLCHERGVEAVVVGVPRTSGGVGRGGRRIQAVVLHLRASLAIPVAEEDESGSTQEAERCLAAEGVARRRWPAFVDGVAAEVILRRHLARRAAPSDGGTNAR